jgi:D-xylose transport system substrate-binding protein
MSVFKSYPAEAETVAKMAVSIAKTDKLDSSLKTSTVDSGTEKGIPSVIVPVVSLTQDNIKDTVVKEGYYTLDDICTAKYKAACNKIGLN